MIKKFILAVFALGVVITAIVVVKAIQFSPPPPFEFPPESVTSAQATAQSWEQTYSATGTVRAIQGVRLASELAGTVTRVVMESGQEVQAGDLIFELDTRNEVAQLESALAAEKLAAINLARARQLFERATISEAELDTAQAQAQETTARVQDLRATLDKKTIRAPFSGRLGIRKVDLGEYVSPGTELVSLQNLDTVYVDFTLPQSQLESIAVGYRVRVRSQPYADIVTEGHISAIDPDVDADTRTLRVRATLPNPEAKLMPGMYAMVEVVQPVPLEVVAIPNTAVYYQSFGNVVFVIVDKTNEATGKTSQVVEERFVRLGAKKGDYVAVLEGVKKGETVVSAGVFKLSNGRAVMVNNEAALEYSIDPQPQDS